VPAVVELSTALDQRQILALYASGSEIGRAVVAPPGVPTDMLAQLRSAFTEAMQDAALLDDVQKSRMDIDPMAGQELQALVGRSVDVSPETLEQARRLTK
jgi:tripartite-type tricarboxylate transporter receptor subunit TctC